MVFTVGILSYFNWRYFYRGCHRKRKRSACAFNRGRFREGFHNFIEGATEKENFKNAKELMVGVKISFRSVCVRGGLLTICSSLLHSRSASSSIEDRGELSYFYYRATLMRGSYYFDARELLFLMRGSYYFDADARELLF